MQQEVEQLVLGLVRVF